MRSYENVAKRAIFHDKEVRMTDGNWIAWLPEKGTIDSSYGRLIIYAEGFVRGFVEEMIKTGGPGLTLKFMKDMCASMDIDIPQKEEFRWDDFEALLDKYLGPFGEIKNLPGDLKGWDGSSRKLMLQNNITGKLWPVAMIKALMDSAEMSLSERGARSIVGHASWRAGRRFGEVLGGVWGWDTKEKVFNTLGDIMTPWFRSLGWGLLKIKVDKADDLIAFIITHSYEAEARGRDSQLTIARNQIEGVGDYLTSLEKQTSKSKEYALGDADDTRVIVLKIHTLGEEVDVDAEPWRKLVGV
jgi:hypothetical protein